MSYFSGKRAVITGAGSGIGRALAQLLNTQGCELWLCDVNGETLEQTQASLSNADSVSHITVFDIADAAAMHAWMNDVIESTPSIDLVVNNAGVALFAKVGETRHEDFRWLMEINFWGVVRGSQGFLAHLHKADRGHLVNISSVFGLIGVPTQSAYNAAKFAVRGYSEALRQELELDGSSVHVCCVHPGGIDTSIARNARSVDPDSTPDLQAERFAPHARTSPQEAARQILCAAERAHPRLLIGRDAKIIDWVVRLFPARYAKFFKGSFHELQNPPS